MIASLPMYDSSPAAVQEFWRHLVPHLLDAGLKDVPASLTRPTNLDDHWSQPSLLLSQTCSYPLVTRLKNRVRVVGAFKYRVPGCDGIYCRSALVTRENDQATSLAQFRGRKVAYNSDDSQSGYNSIRAQVAPLAQSSVFFSESIRTGSHRKSLELVRDGAADIAAIDCVSLAGFEKHLPDVVKGTEVMSYTAPYPGLPLITAGETSDRTLASLRSVLVDVMQDRDFESARTALYIDDFEPLDLTDFQICRTMRDDAFRLNYRSL